MDTGLALIPFAFPGIPGVRCAFGGVAAGDISLRASADPEAARRARRRARAALGFSSWHSLRQVHGLNMVFDPEKDSLETESAVIGDGLATSRPGRALVIKTADCQPVLLAHAGGRHVAALHVGWRGGVAGFAGLGVLAFCRRYGFSPSEVSAARGPSLGPSWSEFVNFHEEFGPEFRRYYDEVSRTVDLWRLTRDQLITAGVPPERIYALDLCTRSLPAFFSYRRDKTTGRQGSFIWIEEPAA